MTNNIDRATEVIGAWIDDNLPHDETNFGADEGIAQALADAGLLMPDLQGPDLDNRDPAHRAEYKAWWEGPVPNVWNGGLPGELTVQTFPDMPEVLMYEDGEPMEPFSPEEARRLACALLAAADHAEGVGRADA